MRIALIVAMAENRVIGRNNTLPWHLSADLKHFRKLTTGKPIIMGRRTHESIGRPLPERTNIVITRDRHFRSAGCLVVHSVDEALQAAGDADEVMVMGGAQLYEQMLERADRIYLTRVHAEVEGDTWFPALDDAQWCETACESFSADERNDHDYSFVVLDRCQETCSGEVV